MKQLFFVLLLAFRAWAFRGSWNSAVSLRSEVSLRSANLICEGPSGSRCDGPDWYWERYNEHAIPSEAVDGTDCSDQSVPYRSLFVGQIHYPPIGTIPGAIHAGTCDLHVYDDNDDDEAAIYTFCDEVNILCSKRKENIRWIKIHYSDISDLRGVPGIKLISGGNDGHELYIGRHYHEGVRQVGKVDRNAGVALINNDGETVCYYEHFDILIYIPTQCNDPVVPPIPAPPAPQCPACPSCPEPLPTTPPPQCPACPTCPDPLPTTPPPQCPGCPPPVCPEPSPTPPCPSTCPECPITCPDNCEGVKGQGIM